MAAFEKRRFLIWGKTAPELSTKYFETVCTGAVLEDGSPIRLYPIPYRYLEDGDRFRKYQWITARIAKSGFDSRPESYKIDCDSIEIGESIPPDQMEWFARRQTVFRNTSWQFESLDALAEAQARTKQSLGIVTPREILSVEVHPRPTDEEASFDQKREKIRRKWEAESDGWLFEEFVPPELKGLEFVRNRIQVRWTCGSGKAHNMQIMDWEVVELQRRCGDEKALQAVRNHLESGNFSVRFFLGNIKQYPTRFTIVGLWYPKKQTGLLF